VKGFFSHVLITHHTSKRNTPHGLSPRVAIRIRRHGLVNSRQRPCFRFDDWNPGGLESDNNSNDEDDKNGSWE
jgi:hypothetical protein